MEDIEARTANTGLAKLAIHFSKDALVVNRFFFLRKNNYAVSRKLLAAKNLLNQPKLNFNI